MNCIAFVKNFVAALCVASLSFVYADDAGEIVTVKGRGVGEDMASALTDAYRDAIETAVGLYVDAEQMMKNDELIKDQVLTQSNAYIEGYDVLSKKVGDGMVSIKIIAKVRTKALTKKVSGFMEPRTVDVGSALRNQFAKSQTERKRGEDGAALVKKALDGLDVELQTMDCWLAHPDGAIQDDDGKSINVRVKYLFGYRINEDRFFGLMSSLCEVFNQVSIEEPVDVLIPVERGTPFDVTSATKKHVKEGEVALAENPNYEYYSGNAPKEPYVVILVTGVNKLRTVYKARQFMLDKYSAEAIDQWYSKNNPIHSDATIPRYIVTFNDENGDALNQMSIMPTHARNMIKCIHCGSAKFGQNRRLLGFMRIAPWFWQACERYVWTEAKIPRAAMPEIKRVKIELQKQ